MKTLIKCLLLIFAISCFLTVQAISASKVNLLRYPIKLDGKLSGRTIEMWLYQSDNSFEGIYRYGKNKFYLELKGTYNKDGKIELNEYNAKGSNTGVFIGVAYAGVFIGDWVKPNLSKELPFELFVRKGVIFPLVKVDTQETTIKSSSKKKIWTFLYIVIFISPFVLLVFSKYKRSKQMKINDAKATIIEEETLSESAKKGRIFEAYVVGLFDKKFYDLVNAQSDKSFNGRHVENNKYPDLEFRMRSSTGPVSFAIECKYRSFDRWNMPIEFCLEKQLINYKQFEFDRNIKVFIILGIGGQPNNPKYIFLFPVKDLVNTKMTLRELMPYRKNIEKSIYMKTYLETSV